MKYDYVVKQDGKTYQPGEEVPDMGTLSCISSSGNVRKYVGLSKDIQKLPQYENLASVSSCLFVDTSALYVYEATTKTWYEIGA